jgi:hypothetical protein
MSLLDDPAHWRRRAAETRQIARTVSDPGTKALLEVVAESYDELSARAERRLGSSRT